MKWTMRRNYWHMPHWESDNGYQVMRSLRQTAWVLWYPDNSHSIHWFAWTARLAARRHAEQRP